jgi:hypothetical protein
MQNKIIKIEGLTEINLNNLSCPFLVCQICNEQIIQKENPGMVFWNDDEGCGEIKGLIAHKSCMSGVNYNLFQNSIELEDYFYDLLWNCKIKPRKPLDIL